MVSDQQVRKLMKLIQSEETLTIAAAKSGMDEKTARRYRQSGRLPSQCQLEHSWQTRPDPFGDCWPEIQELLQSNPGFEAKTIFADLQRRYPGRFQDGQLRTLQRKMKRWRATEGPPKEVFFPQDYQPGRLCQSDFTHLTKLRVTIRGEAFPHLLYHFVLPYSNWETGTVCFSECFESLSAGLQNALWELGGVPQAHQSDQLSAAVNNYFNPAAFTRRYQGLLHHYGLQGRKIQTGQANENGDIEQRHHRFKRALEQALLLRGHRDFDSREEYESFLQKLFKQLNSGRQERLREELQVLRRLPVRRLDDVQKEKLRVGPSSTIRVKKNTYCVDSRLIGELVEVRIYAERIEVWYGQKQTHRLPRLSGHGKYHINYRYIIDSLVRKPGAFENYRYREELFPTSYFRMAYDLLSKQNQVRAHKEYLKILYLAAKESESGVNEALKWLIEQEQPITAGAVQDRLTSDQIQASIATVSVAEVNLVMYDVLLHQAEVAG
jgi:Mu transposase, C-terminal domain